MTDLRSLVVSTARRHGLAGIAAAVVTRDAPPEIECVGIADRTGRAVDPSSVFRIASVSKTMTALAVMRLRDEGRLNLDDAVNKHLIGLRLEPPPGAPDVTFRHLLTHTGGIGEAPRVRDLASRDIWGAGPPNAHPSDISALYRGVLRTEVATGTKWAYANHGFAVLAKCVEDISGRNFAEFLRAELFDPLGMTQTDAVRSERVSADLADGSHWVLGRFRPVKDYDLTHMGPGSVLAPLRDLTSYATWLLGGDATVREMMTPQFSWDARLPTRMGLGFFLDNFDGHLICGHDGNNPGFASALWIAPDDGVGVVALTNTSTMLGMHRLAQSILRAQLGVPEPASVLASCEVPPLPRLWSDLVGHYAPPPGFLTNFRAWQLTGGEVQVFVRNRQLCMRALSPLPQLRRGVQLRAIDPHDSQLFAAELEGLLLSVAFSSGESGSIDRIAIGAPAMLQLHRRSGRRSSRRRMQTLAAGALGMAAVTRARPRKTC
jgi:CubicO group peptidase (beta-lactamase class C family)